VNKESCEHGIKSYALRMCLVLGLLGLLIAYAAGSCRNKRQSIFLIAVAVAVLISLVIQVLLSSMHDTLRRPLAQLMEYMQQLVEWLQSHVFRTQDVRRGNTPDSSENSNCNGKDVRKRHKYLMLIATLAASITYQAGLNPPGGLWSDDDNGHLEGDPLLHDINHGRYKTFFCFNAISFMISIAVIMLLLSKSVRKQDGLLEVLLCVIVLDLLSLITAFAAGSCRKLSTSLYVFLLVGGTVLYLMLFIVLSRAIAKFFRIGHFSSRHPDRVSRTVTPVSGEQP
jgi:cytochrome c biogenesis factor